MADAEYFADDSTDRDAANHSANPSAQDSDRDAADEAAHAAGRSTLTLAGRRRKTFTLLEANRTLPLVRRIAADIVRTHSQAKRLHTQLTRKLPRNDRHVLSVELDAIVSKLQGFVDELAEIGVELKDYQLGLLDFVSYHQGREVYLCWKLGEERITHWHELDSGIQGRQPVSILQQ